MNENTYIIIGEYDDDYYHIHLYIEFITPNTSPKYLKTKFFDSEILSKVMLSGLYHAYRKSFLILSILVPQVQNLVVL